MLFGTTRVLASVHVLVEHRFVSALPFASSRGWRSSLVDPR